MTNPERGENFPELPKHVELHSVAREDFFAWIQNDIARNRMLKGDMIFNRTYVDDIIEPLEEYITHTFGGKLPELVIQTLDATRTHSVQSLGGVITSIRAESVPRDDTAQIDNEDIYAGITVVGRLFGFRKGEEGDLRILIEDERLKETVLSGGVYTPYISVAVEGSVIEYATDPKDAFKELNLKIIDKIEKMDTGGGIRGLYVSLLNRLDATENTLKTKLVNVSYIISEFAQNIEKFEEDPLMEDLFEVIKYKLNLEEPHTIRTSIHRIDGEGRYIKSYSIGGPDVFRHVFVQLDMIGESSRRGLGLTFWTDDIKPKGIRLPIDNIKDIVNEASAQEKNI